MAHVGQRLFFGLVIISIGSCKTDPSTASYWEKRLDSAKSRQDKVRVIDELRDSKFMGPAMLTLLQQHLASEKGADVKASIARLLGQSADKSSTDALLEALSPGVSDMETSMLNREIVTALGHIGDPKVIPTLVKILNGKDQFVVAAAIDSLGELKAKEAFEPLNSLALTTDDAVSPLTNKKAIIALGDLRDPRAVPTLVRAMYFQRKSANYYGEASFALYQLGAPAADALVKIVDGQDKELRAWADERKYLPFVLPAKALQVLGDLHDQRAERAILTYLDFQSEFEDVRLIVRGRAADAAGRMRLASATSKLSKLVGEEEPNTRHEYVWALTRIGDAKVVPALAAAARKGQWPARNEAIRGIAMLGDDPDALKQFATEESAVYTKECSGYPDEPTCKDVPGEVKKHTDAIATYAAAVEAGKACKSDVQCWTTRLDDSNAVVRERAAYTVGRSKDASVLPNLMSRMKEKERTTRAAFIQAADWLIFDVPQAKAAAKGNLSALNAQLLEEKSKTEYILVNEDLRRLVVAIQRQ